MVIFFLIAEISLRGIQAIGNEGPYIQRGILNQYTAEDDCVGG